MQAATPPDEGDKKAWRRWFRDRLTALDDAAGQAAAVRRHLDERLSQTPVQRVAAFAAMPGEIDLLPLVEDSRHHWHFPRIDGNRLTFHRIMRLGDLVPDTYGILTPRAELPSIGTDDLDLFLVPGLGFGRDGSRLGRGMGFYDRVLAETRAGVPRMGITFRQQIVEHVPTEAHDVVMTHLVTADGLHPVPLGR